MAEKLRNDLNNLASQGHSQKDAIEKYRIHITEILKLEKPVLIEMLKIFLSTSKCITQNFIFDLFIYLFNFKNLLIVTVENNNSNTIDGFVRFIDCFILQ